jgi:hypothetical protein
MCSVPYVVVPFTVNDTLWSAAPTVPDDPPGPAEPQAASPVQTIAAAAAHATRMPLLCLEPTRCRFRNMVA